MRGSPGRVGSTGATGIRGPPGPKGDPGSGDPTAVRSTSTFESDAWNIVLIIWLAIITMCIIVIVIILVCCVQVRRRRKKEERNSRSYEHAQRTQLKGPMASTFYAGAGGANGSVPGSMRITGDWTDQLKEERETVYTTGHIDENSDTSLVPGSSNSTASFGNNGHDIYQGTLPTQQNRTLSDNTRITTIHNPHSSRLSDNRGSSHSSNRRHTGRQGLYSDSTNSNMQLY